MLGYTVNFVNKVKEADSRKVGVQLGLVAIDKNIPISSIAEGIGVSRMAVYDWFTGRFNPNENNIKALQEFLDAQ